MVFDMTNSELEGLLAEAGAAPFEGWDFSWLSDRYSIEQLAWDYRSIIEAAILEAGSVLDMGTGGGEFLSTIQPLPGLTVATEAHPPNWTMAAKQLGPRGVSVVAVDPAQDNNQPGNEGGALPFGSESFNLVINRHEAYSPAEVARVLTPDGAFITQQVGSRDQAELLEWFDRPPVDEPDWNLGVAVAQLEAVGLRVTEKGEAHPASTFADVGALAYYLRAVPWALPGFDIVTDRHHLARLHETTQLTGHPIRATSHRFWLTAR